MTLEQEIIQILNQIPAAIEKAVMGVWVQRHPGHANQKTHGNRFGGYSATKESLRRLKDDKGAREQYKEKVRARNKPSTISWYGKGKTKSKPKQTVTQSTKVDLSPEDTGLMSAISSSAKKTPGGETFLMGPASSLSEGVGFKAVNKDMAKKWRQVVDKGVVKESVVIPGTSRYTLTELGRKLLK